MEKAREELADDIRIRSALQFAFYEQWRALRRYCAERAIRIVGDVAIFMNHDSADVWTHRELFRLNENLEPEVVAGVPPDFFSKTGQRWGNPLYRWDVMKQRGYQWWIQRLRWATQNCDYIRLDHFRGFDQFWEIPASDDTAVNGRWVDGPRDDLFLKLREALGGLPFFAEDLGYITPEVHALRERLQIPGMAVLQFGFGDEGAHMYLPHRAAGKVIYTGTHDNDTVEGWWHSGAAEHERRNAEAYVGRCEDGIHWAFIRAAQCSPASLSIIPLQDVLGLGSEARMNTPSLHGGNWRWRFEPAAAQERTGREIGASRRSERSSSQAIRRAGGRELRRAESGRADLNCESECYRRLRFALLRRSCIEGRGVISVSEAGRSSDHRSRRRGEVLSAGGWNADSGCRADQSRDRTGEDRCAAGTLRLRQVHAAAHADRAVATDVGNAPVARQAARRPDAERGHRFSELRSVPLAHRAGERRSSAGSQGSARRSSAANALCARSIRSVWMVSKRPIPRNFPAA